MTETNMFERASIRKYRYNYKGSITVEDLFDLNKVELNEIYQKLNASIKSNESTLLDSITVTDKDLDTKIEIVKYIFNKKVIADNAAMQAHETYVKKQKIMEIISKKKDESLEDTSVEELEKMLDGL